MEKKKLDSHQAHFSIVLLIIFGFALPVVAGIAIYKVVKKMKAKSVPQTETEENVIGEGAWQEESIQAEE